MIGKGHEEVVLRVKVHRNILHAIRKRKANWICHLCVESAFYNMLLKERNKGDRSERKKM
jgi:hypothetical protein